MEDNQLKKSVYLFASVIAILFLLSLVGEFSLGSFKFKKVNLLADVQQEPLKVVKKDSTKKKASTPVRKPETCKPGITCLEDFSADNNGLGRFFQALRETGRRPVKIAFFGDSFIEGDILCSSFRDTLQQLYGGRGVGYVPITSEVTMFRTTIQHVFSGWKTFWIVGDKSPFSPLGFSGYCFVPQPDNEVEYRPGRRRSGKFHSVKIFYKSPLPAGLHYTIDDSLAFDRELAPAETLQQELLSCKGAQAVKLHFEPVDSLKLYGVSFEEPAGIYVDNFSMRGNSGIGLYQIDPIQLQEFNHYQNYKLVVLQYGLNVVTETDSIGYDWYVDKMVRVIARLKESLPGSNFLLISVSDRSYNHNGRFVTIPNIVIMRNAQREIARRSKIAFWDLLTAMKGKNSMANLVNANPTLASKDYTHVNFGGGRKLAKMLAEAILYERLKHEPKRKKTH